MSTQRNDSENRSQETDKRPPQETYVIVRKVLFSSYLDRIFKAYKGIESINEIIFQTVKDGGTPDEYEFLDDIETRYGLHGAIELLVGIIAEAEHELDELASKSEEVLK